MGVLNYCEISRSITKPRVRRKIKRRDLHQIVTKFLQKLGRIQSSPAFELDLCNRLLLRKAQRKKGVNFTQIWNSTFEILSKYEKAKRVTLGKHVMSSVGTSPVFLPCPCGYKMFCLLLFLNIRPALGYIMGRKNSLKIYKQFYHFTS